jgi:hypothetical protein
MVCHLLVATNHLSSFRRQLRSMTSLLLSLSSADRTARRRSLLKTLSGKRYDVMMTYCA